MANLKGTVSQKHELLEFAKVQTVLSSVLIEKACVHLCRHQKQAIFKNNSVLQTFASISKIYVQFLKFVLQSLTVFIGFHNPFSFQQYYPARTIFGQFAALNDLSTLYHISFSAVTARLQNNLTLKR